MALPTYQTGTVSVDAGGTVVTGSDTIWSGLNAVAGDLIAIDGAAPSLITEVTDVTHLAIPPWQGDAKTDVPYVIYRISSLRFADVQLALDLEKQVQALNTQGFYVFVPSSAAAPDPSLGDDGQYAYQAATGKLWIKEAGLWSFVGIYKGLSPKGDYDPEAPYAINDVVTKDGSSYLVTAPTTGHAPPDVAYYQVLAAKGDPGDQGERGAGYGGTSTTSLTIGTGAKAFVTQAGLAYLDGARVRASSAADPTNWMEGLATYSGTSLTIAVTKTSGAGTHADWHFNVAGEPGSGTGDLLSANNLSDLDDASTALTNLGLSSVGKALVEAPYVQGAREIASALMVVRTVATANVNIASGLENGDAVSGVTLATNDLVLLTAQTAAAENGVYVVAASGAASRHASFATYDAHPGCYFSVCEGAGVGDTLWRCTSDRGGTLGTTALVVSQFTAGAAGRELLAVNRTYYVRTDGNDSNDGLSNTSGGAFKTILHAYNLICATLDLAGYTVTIQIADGTYAEQVSITTGWTGGGQIRIQGNTSAQDNVVIAPTSGQCIVAIGGTVSGILRLRYMKLAPPAGSYAINLNAPCWLQFDNLNFAGTSGGYHIACGHPLGYVQIIGNYTISGGANAHILCTNKGQVANFPNAITCTLTGTPAFASAFIYALSLSWINLPGVTWNGSATGSRFMVAGNSVIDTQGQSETGYLPGNSNGSKTSGGLYL